MAQTSITSSAQITSAVGALREQIASYTKSVNRLMEIGNEVDGMWDGEASEKFMTILRADEAKFNSLSDMMTKYANTLEEVVSTYEKAEGDALDTVAVKKF